MLPAIISKLIAHAPDEAHALISMIEPYQFLGMGGTLATLGHLFWRYRARRSGQDVGSGIAYGLIALVGLAWIFVLGDTGGNLVSAYGINAREVNPRLP